jgi:hypothetical protein
VPPKVAFIQLTWYCTQVDSNDEHYTVIINVPKGTTQRMQ